jgi:DNA replication and repair protein RecF
MNTVISQADASYLDAVMRYNKALEQRNAMLRRDMRDPLLYESVEQVLCDTAALIHERRAKWIEQFTPIFMRYYTSIAGVDEVVRMSYQSHLNDAPMTAVLAAHRERDMALGYTSHGVHRDDIDLQLGDYSMRRTGSQGQCKTYTIALRLAQFDFIKQVSSTTPILLLDDIFDRLDARRVERIVDVVSSDRFGQIFITDTNRTHLDEILARTAGDHCMLSVHEGVVTPQQEGGEQ